MADNATPTGGAAPAAPVQTPITTLPEVKERLTVPASALGLDTDLPPIKTDVVDNTPKPIAPTAPAAAPAAPAPAATGPSGPASTPAAAPAATGPSGPAAPAAPEKKIKVGDKEYTEAELNKILEDRNKPAAPAAPAAAAEPAPAAPKQLTPEEIFAVEEKWRNDFATEHKVNFPTTDAEMEVILGGGKEAVEAFQKKLQDVATKAVLLARKTMYADLNPQMEKFRQQVEPLFANHAQVERVATEQAFIASYPEYQGQHIETARQVAEALVARYPDQVSKMSQQDFLAHVNKHTDAILQSEYKRWNPSATDTWRDAAKRGAAAPAPAATTTTTAPVVPAPAVPAPAPAPSPWQTPPAVNAPASIPAGAPADWNKGVAKSLQD